MLKNWVNKLFNTKKIDIETLEELEDSLIMADFGVNVTADVIYKFKNYHLGKDVNIKTEISKHIAEVLQPSQRDLVIEDKKPFVIMMTGVNGSGKTTTIGKLANLYKKQGKKVSLVAADTFRAAAVAQLTAWGDKNKINVYTGAPNSDPASLCFDSLYKSKENGDDILIIDTAGRLENKTNLMEELKKMVKVLQKIDPSAPHAKILSVDATTGQNAIGQVKTFNQFIHLDGLVVNKLDGSSKAGVVVAISQEYKLPIFYVGTGEKIGDIKPFNAQDFADTLFNE
ncbi:MAG: signal recognition particle-docking protein FtsY [Alphaproteobacteria bacterium]